MKKEQQPKKGGAMKRYVFLTHLFELICLLVDSENNIIRITKFDYSVNMKTRKKTGHIIKILDNPKIMLNKKAHYINGPFIQFNQQQWEQGGEFYIAADDIYRFEIQPTGDVICEACELFPVHQFIGYWSNGKKYTQGHRGMFSQELNRKQHLCNACYVAFGGEIDPNDDLPAYSQAMEIADAASSIVGIIDVLIEMQDIVDGPDEKSREVDPNKVDQANAKIEKIFNIWNNGVQAEQAIQHEVDRGIKDIEDWLSNS